jgi:hypothetical protein
MANGGWYETKEEWDRIEKPLLEIDFILDKFAKEKGLTFTKNLKDWPERSITWNNGVRCLMQLYLVNDKLLTFNLWLCASQDRGSDRFWKKENQIKEQAVSEFKETLEFHLHEGYCKLKSWAENEDELEFATKVHAT